VEHAWDTMTMAIQVGTIFIDHSLMPLLLLPETYKLESSDGWSISCSFGLLVKCCVLNSFHSFQLI